MFVRPSVEAGLFLASAPRRCDLAGAHQVTNVFLKKLVVVVELVVFLLDRFYPAEDGQQGVLELLGVSMSMLVRCWRKGKTQ